MTTTKWAIDPIHSQIGFKVKHLMVTNVRGHFREYEARIATDGVNLETAEIDLLISAGSIHTNDSKRDEHLKSGDFFDVINFPKIQFVATRLEKTDTEDFYFLFGDLTMKGITRPVRLTVEFGGIVRDPWGNEKAALSIEGTINRRDWGLSWNAPLETGGLLIGEEVAFDIEVQMAKQA